MNQHSLGTEWTKRDDYRNGSRVVVGDSTYGRTGNGEPVSVHADNFALDFSHVYVTCNESIGRRYIKY